MFWFSIKNNPLCGSTIHGKPQMITPCLHRMPRGKSCEDPAENSATRVERAMVVLVSRDFKRYTLVMGSGYITLILGKLLDMDLAGFHMKFGGCYFGWVPWRIHVFLKSIKCPQPRFTQFVAFNRGQNLSQKKNMDLQHAICRSGKTFCKKKLGSIFGTRGVNVHFVSSEHHLFIWLLHPALSQVAFSTHPKTMLWSWNSDRWGSRTIAKLSITSHIYGLWFWCIYAENRTFARNRCFLARNGPSFSRTPRSPRIVVAGNCETRHEAFLCRTRREGPHLVHPPSLQGG